MLKHISELLFAKNYELATILMKSQNVSVEELSDYIVNAAYPKELQIEKFIPVENVFKLDFQTVLADYTVIDSFKYEDCIIHFCIYLNSDVIQFTVSNTTKLGINIFMMIRCFCNIDVNVNDVEKIPQLYKLEHQRFKAHLIQRISNICTEYP